MQKEKGYIDGKKGVQISIVATKIVTQERSQLMIVVLKQAICHINPIFFCYFAHTMLLI